jgi:hypothetical protein
MTARRKSSWHTRSFTDVEHISATDGYQSFVHQHSCS